MSVGLGFTYNGVLEDKGVGTNTLGHTSFTDLRRDEFKASGRNDDAGNIGLHPGLLVRYHGTRSASDTAVVLDHRGAVARRNTVPPRRDCQHCQSL